MANLVNLVKRAVVVRRKLTVQNVDATSPLLAGYLYNRTDGVWKSA